MKNICLHGKCCFMLIFRDMQWFVQLAEQSAPCQRHGSDHIEHQHGIGYVVLHVPAKDHHQIDRPQMDDRDCSVELHTVLCSKWVCRLGNDDNCQHLDGRLGRPHSTWYRQVSQKENRENQLNQYTVKIVKCGHLSDRVNCPQVS